MCWWFLDVVVVFVGFLDFMDVFCMVFNIVFEGGGIVGGYVCRFFGWKFRKYIYVIMFLSLLVIMYDNVKVNGIFWSLVEWFLKEFVEMFMKKFLVMLCSVGEV